MFGRIWNLVWKEAIQFSRHRLLLVFILTFPVWNLMSVANSVSQGVMHIPTAVYDQDHSQASRRLVTKLRHSRRFAPDYYVSSRAELEQLLEQGTVAVGLLIPHDFGAGLSAGGQGATAQVLLDGTETTTALIARIYLEGTVYDYTRQMLNEELGRVETRERVWFNENLRDENIRLPIEMSGVLMMLAMFLPVIAIVREREMGTLEQIFVTPLRPIELVVGKSLLALLITYLNFLGMLAMIVLHFQVPLWGAPALLAILTAYYIFVEMGWGLLISAIARTQGQALMAAFVIQFPEMMLSGQVPVEMLPRVAQVVSNLVPNKYYNDIVVSIMLKGSTLADLWPQVVALGVLGVALYTLAAACLRKRLD
jgi:ABC-2 type transport system permease protein